jgi:hypothetical protein
MVVRMARGFASLEFPSTYTMLRDSLPPGRENCADKSALRLSWMRRLPHQASKAGMTCCASSVRVSASLPAMPHRKYWKPTSARISGLNCVARRIEL